MNSVCCAEQALRRQGALASMPSSVITSRLVPLPLSKAASIGGHFDGAPSMKSALTSVSTSRAAKAPLMIPHG